MNATAANATTASATPMNRTPRKPSRNVAGGTPAVAEVPAKAW